MAQTVVGEVGTTGGVVVTEVDGVVVVVDGDAGVEVVVVCCD